MTVLLLSMKKLGARARAAASAAQSMGLNASHHASTLLGSDAFDGIAMLSTFASTIALHVSLIGVWRRRHNHYACRYACNKRTTTTTTTKKNRLCPYNMCVRSDSSPSDCSPTPSKTSRSPTSDLVKHPTMLSEACVSVLEL